MSIVPAVNCLDSSLLSNPLNRWLRLAGWVVSLQNLGELHMIKIISNHRGVHADRMEIRHDEIELMQAAASFFADRLLTRGQQKRMTLLIEFSAASRQTSISVEQLTGKEGLFGFRPPRLFEMTISSTAGMRLAFLHLAIEMVYVAQVTTCRLALFPKKGAAVGTSVIGLKARWLGRRENYLEAVPRGKRLWVIEALEIAPRLVEEFFDLALGNIDVLARQPATAHRMGLHCIDGTNAAIRENLMTMAHQIDAIRREKGQISLPRIDVSDDWSADIDTALTVPKAKGAHVRSGGHTGLPAGPEFTINVMVPNLGMTRRLNSAALDRKLNELFERGLVQKPAVEAARLLAVERNRRAKLGPQ
jgi:hypothetical protein